MSDKNYDRQSKGKDKREKRSERGTQGLSTVKDYLMNLSTSLMLARKTMRRTIRVGIGQTFHHHIVY